MRRERKKMIEKPMTPAALGTPSEIAPSTLKPDLQSYAAQMLKTEVPQLSINTHLPFHLCHHFVS